MIGVALLAIGLVLIIEGLVYALAPSLVEAMLEALRQMPIDMRRTMGLLIVVAGACLLILARALGAL